MAGVVILLAGCVAPAATPDDASDAAPALPNSLEVDLHEYVLNITMPAGQPTMLVALNVTKDMWVRPYVARQGGPEGPRSEAFWTICPWVQVTGLLSGFSVLAMPFWLEEGVLRPAAHEMLRWELRGGDGGVCVGAFSEAQRSSAVAADAPRDATLVLLLAGFPDVLQAPDAAKTVPGFGALVGVGRTVCADEFRGASFCPPGDEIAAAPDLRGGRTVVSRYVDHLPAYGSVTGLPSECHDCGFVIQDDRLQPAPDTAIAPGPASGRVAATRTGVLARGIIYAHAGIVIDFKPGIGDVAASLQTFGIEIVRGECADESHSGNVVVDLVASSVEPIEFAAHFNLTGSKNFEVRLDEIDLDPSKLGWRIHPVVAAAYSGAPASLADKGDTCQ